MDFRHRSLGHLLAASRKAKLVAVVSFLLIFYPAKQHPR